MLGKFLTVDPGEDCGWSVWNGDDLLDAGTTKMWEFSDRLWIGGFDTRPQPPEALLEATAEDDCYLAGLLDGEAWIGISNKNNEAKTDCSVVRVTMTTPEPLQWAQYRYGGAINGPYSKPDRKDIWDWKVGKQAEVFFILERVLPHLKVKYQDALKAIHNLEKTRFGKRTDRLTEVVCEDWRLYPWELRTGHMDWDPCRTARLIGSITQFCRVRDIPLVLQPALIKERAVAAGAESYFSRPLRENRHANDAIMHGVYRNAVERSAPWTDLSQRSWNIDVDA